MNMSGFGSTGSTLQRPFGGSTGDLPLSGLTFAQAGRLSITKRQLAAMIRDNGGAYMSSINHKVRILQVFLFCD